MTSNTTSSCIFQYCSNTYQDPRILSCLQSYCVHCITKLHVENTTSVISPTCNHSTTLPNGSVTSLPRNIRLSKETKLDTVLSKVASTSPPPCDSCDENSLIAYCTECDKIYVMYVGNLGCTPDTQIITFTFFLHSQRS